ncbi:MAG: hypothetical protein OXC95_03890 [Dehalococcoidia bacterium]|nr:hypothetical protein [Dehalococcoidia bacterium]
MAVAHKVISELNDVGKTRLQKLCYFLQESFHVPTRYTYKMHHYGPYSEALETDVSRLRLTGYVSIKPDPRGYGFHISPVDAPEPEWVEMSNEYISSINGALNLFKEWPPSKLELAATIHFVNNLLPNESASEIHLRVKALKPKFFDDYISEVHEEIEQLGLLRRTDV